MLTVLGVASWSASLGSIHPYQSTSIGLVSQLTALWWLGLGLAAVGVFLELRRESPRTLVMVFTLVGFALILHGTLPATEPVPRFSSAYVVAGFSNYIGLTGHALPKLDVRMSWPAMFAATGMAARAMGVSTLWFLRWCPLVLNLAYLAPLKAISNTCLRTSRARWTVLAIFLASNWIDQDYFSPQGVNLFLFLTAVAITIRVFANGSLPLLVQRVTDARIWARVKTFSVEALQLPYGAVPSEQPETGTTVGYRVGMLVVLLAVLGTSAVTHQITPAALCLVFFALAMTGRTNLRMIWLLMAVLVWAWLSWEARAYWSNHLAKVFGSAGQVGSTINSTVAARLSGSTLGRTVVQDGRLLTAAVTMIGATAGAWALWRRGRTMWTMIIVGAAPVLVAGAVSYGGEVALRVLLFGLAPAAVLTAGLIDYRALRRSSVIFVTGLVAVLLVLFPLDRFGNEVFEAIAPGDLAAAAWVHAHVPAGARVYVVNRDEPLNFSHVGEYKLVEFGVILGLSGTQLSDHLPYTHVPTYVYFTRSQANYGSDYLGYPNDWLSTFTTQLLKTGYVHVVYKSSTAIVLRIVKNPPPQHVKPVVVPHPKVHVVVPPRPKPTPVVRPKPPRTTLPPKPPPTTHPPRSTTTTTRAPSSSTTRPPSTTTTNPAFGFGTVTS